MENNLKTDKNILSCWHSFIWTQSSCTGNRMKIFVRLKINFTGWKFKEYTEYAKWLKRQRKAKLKVTCTICHSKGLSHSHEENWELKKRNTERKQTQSKR